MSVAMIFPGQGSQSVGMLADLAEAEPAVRETFDEASDCLGYDLWDLCQAGPEELLGRTDHTQPAMLTAGVAVFRAWKARGGAAAAVMAGHSLGEYTALVCAGYLDLRSGVCWRFAIQHRTQTRGSSRSSHAGGGTRRKRRPGSDSRPR